MKQTIAIYTLTSGLHDEKAVSAVTHPIGNHHIIMPGHCQAVVEQLLNAIQSK